MRPLPNRYTILLVDDADDTLRPLARLLQFSGYDVRLAHNTAEALAVAGEGGRLDLVISDLGLPDGSGFDLMRDVKARFGLRGIAVTGYDGAQTVDACRSAGFERHFAKPVLFEDLCAALSELLPSMQ